MWKRNNCPTECDKSTVRCHVSIAQCNDGTFICKKKNKSTTECDKNTVKCNIGTAQCDDGTI